MGGAWSAVVVLVHAGVYAHERSLGPRLSLPYACRIFTYDLWTPRSEKSGREPGIFYHVSDVEGREN